MKIRRLDLIAYGPFTDVSLDLSAGARGLHLIHGPNEAGKSSALRAIHDLFYGIPLRSSDNFIHDYNQLRIGAEIEDSQGRVLEFRRRKGSRNTLLSADDETPLEPGAIDRFLGGVESETFRSLFGIDHRRLVEGGKAILEGRGQVGQLLFAAGSGLTGLQAATSSIQAELDLLFKPRGQNPEINRLLGELNGLRKQVQERQLPGEEWTWHDEAFREATRKKEGLDRHRQDRVRERNRLLRIRDALTPIVEREQLLGRLDAVRDVVPLPVDFADRHRTARESLTRAVALAEQADSDLGSFEERLQAISPPDEVLAKAEAIESLHRRLGEFLKGQQDRPGLLRMQQGDEHFARNLLVELGKPRDLQAAESLRIRGDMPERIRELGRQRASIDADLAGHRQALESLGDQLRELTGAVDPTGPEPDVEPVRRVVSRCHRLGDPESELARGLVELEDERGSLQLDLQRLPHWSGPLDELSRLRVPLEETITEVSREISDLERLIGRADDELAEVGDQLEVVDAEIRALELEQGVPTEADLVSSRLRRDMGWRLVRLDWLDRGSPPDERSSFVDEYAPGGTLREAFERSMAHCDEQADRLRREADRVARRSECLARRERLSRRRDELARDRQDGADRLRDIRGRWDAHLLAEGLPALGPEELRAWVRRRAELVSVRETLRLRQRELDALSRTIAEHRSAIDAALAEAGNYGMNPADSLADRVDRASAFINMAEEARATRRESLRSIERTRRDRDDAERRLREAERRLEAWRESWSPLMARLGLEPESTPAQADSFLRRIEALWSHLDQARGFRSRVEGIDRDARQFADDVAAVARVIAPELVDRPAEAAVSEVYRRLGEARDHRKERDSIASNRDDARLKLRSANLTIAQETARLQALCREARCDTPDDLPEAEATAAERARLEADLRRVEDLIRSCCAGSSLDAFISESRGIDPDGLELRIDELDEEIELIERDRSALDQSIGGEREWLRAQRGGDEAADAAERTQSLLAEVRSRVEDYAALRLALELLQCGIEEFREENQGPILRRAGELFTTLTAGSFQGLGLGEDDHGQPVLLGLRDGRPVGVESMSDGSCDQLYLALRLASLEGWFARHEPIPLVADDILLNFDDERSAAALVALAELSRRTQVLFFTHHEHLVELAQAHLPNDVRTIHRLESRGVAASTAP
ncbi:YhaN family protein [Tautonia plasticadhaerens]|uniref:YhaN AAA domain-containing protein n=1 Tax=Tautonia plasticadhaerens TaxID=2527974 RepID=A0A518H922_9BACT|nr:YhaN family protein [Tautonia plasticadhaerens]QDV37352.1 hypothetical protein ElP_52890 [Tautonia plasticadhaerens]